MSPAKSCALSFMVDSGSRSRILLYLKVYYQIVVSPTGRPDGGEPSSSILEKGGVNSASRPAFLKVNSASTSRAND